MKEKTVKEQLHGFPDDLRFALGWNPGTFDCDNVLLCGMGGSAISGAIAADMFMEKSKIPLVTVKNFSIPAWASERTLAIVSSYSGNTVETLKMYKAVKDAGCNIVAITSGGKLKDLCDKDGVLVKILPTNMQPRHSIGFMIGYTIAILEGCGCVCASEDMARILDSLESYRDFLESEDGSVMIDRMVDRLQGSVPTIVSDGFMQSVAFRWKTQVNENSKFVAFCGSFSEYDCKAMGKWAKEGDKNLILVALGNVANAENPKRIVINFGKEDPVEGAFLAIMLGDHISMRMAEKRGIDPESVAPIKGLKSKLAKMPYTVCD